MKTIKLRGVKLFSQDPMASKWQLWDLNQVFLTPNIFLMTAVYLPYFVDIIYLCLSPNWIANHSRTALCLIYFLP